VAVHFDSETEKNLPRHSVLIWGVRLTFGYFGLKLGVFSKISSKPTLFVLMTCACVNLSKISPFLWFSNNFDESMG